MKKTLGAISVLLFMMAFNISYAQSVYIEAVGVIPFEICGVKVSCTSETGHPIEKTYSINSEQARISDHELKSAKCAYGSTVKIHACAQDDWGLCHPSFSYDESDTTEFKFKVDHTAHCFPYS